jgi:hypothetical protein
MWNQGKQYCQIFFVNNVFFKIDFCRKKYFFANYFFTAELSHFLGTKIWKKSLFLKNIFLEKLKFGYKGFLEFFVLTKWLSCSVTNKTGGKYFVGKKNFRKTFFQKQIIFWISYPTKVAKFWSKKTNIKKTNTTFHVLNLKQKYFGIFTTNRYLLCT